MVLRFNIKKRHKTVSKLYFWKKNNCEFSLLNDLKLIPSHAISWLLVQLEYCPSVNATR